MMPTVRPAQARTRDRGRCNPLCTIDQGIFVWARITPQSTHTAVRQIESPQRSSSPGRSGRLSKIHERMETPADAPSPTAICCCAESVTEGESMVTRFRLLGAGQYTRSRASAQERFPAGVSRPCGTRGRSVGRNATRDFGGAESEAHYASRAQPGQCQSAGSTVFPVARCSRGERPPHVFLAREGGKRQRRVAPLPRARLLMRRRKRARLRSHANIAHKPCGRKSGTLENRRCGNRDLDIAPYLDDLREELASIALVVHAPARDPAGDDVPRRPPPRSGGFALTGVLARREGKRERGHLAPTATLNDTTPP